MPEQTPIEISRRDLLVPALIVLAFLPLAIPAASLYFSGDDLMNLDYYVARPGQTVLANFTVFTSFRRPLGGAILLASYYAAGMNPLPLYLLAPFLAAMNMVLWYLLVMRFTGDRALAGLAALPLLFHPHVRMVLYDAGALYELLCLAGLLGAMHCYHSFRTTGRPLWYVATLASWILALNAKEVAVILPALLLVYELVFAGPSRGSGRWKSLLAALTPILAIGLFYGLAKTLGAEAAWRHNAAYAADLDPVRLYDRLGFYFTEVTWGWRHFGDPELTRVLLACLGLTALLRLPPMIFGLAWFFASLAPTLILPRVWVLFLYIPLAGIGLFVAALLLGVARWLETKRHLRVELSRKARVLLFVGALLLLNLAVRAQFSAYFDGPLALDREPWREFATQLIESYPEPPAAVLGFRNPPFPPISTAWTLHHLVRLTYRDRDLAVYRLPEQRADFEAAAARARHAAFDWVDGSLRLLEVAEPGRLQSEPLPGFGDNRLTDRPGTE